MKSYFNQKTREELINRINMLHENSKAQWGKMTVYQMLKHCVKWEEMLFGKIKYKQSFIGKLFGKSALKSMIKDETPMKKNMPTVPGFKITDSGDVALEKSKWISLMHEHDHYSSTEFVHPFFGRMTKDELGYLAYKHIDHHLRQFNC